MKQKLLNIKEAANYLSLTVKAIYQLVHRKKIPVVRLGRTLRFDIDILNQWIANNQNDVIS